MINSCYKLMLDAFCDCLFDKEYSLLGAGTEQEQQEAWNKIYIEYCDLMNDASYNESFNLVVEINRTNAKINLIAASVDYLMIKKDDDIEKILRSLGVVPNEKMQKSAIARIKRLTMEMQNMQQVLNKLMEKKTVAGRNIFEDNLLVFGAERKIHLSATTTTVYQFCRMYKEHELLSQKNALSARH